MWSKLVWCHNAITLPKKSQKIFIQTVFSTLFISLNSVSFTSQTRNFEDKITMPRLFNTESSLNGKRFCIALNPYDEYLNFSHCLKPFDWRIKDNRCPCSVRHNWKKQISIENGINNTKMDTLKRQSLQPTQ